MKRQRGILTWDMWVVVIAFNAATSTPIMKERVFPNYPTLASCLTAVDELNSAFSAVRTEEAPGRINLEWKARCVKRGAP